MNTNVPRPAGGGTAPSGPATPLGLTRTASAGNPASATIHRRIVSLTATGRTPPRRAEARYSVLATVTSALAGAEPA